MPKRRSSQNSNSTPLDDLLWSGFIADSFGPPTMPRGPGTGVRIIGDTRRTGMNRRRLWAAGVVLVLLVVGAGVVLAGGAGYAEDNGDNGDENAGAKCSEATLDGTYLFAHDGVDISGNDQAPFTIAGHEQFAGNGKVKAVISDLSMPSK